MAPLPLVFISVGILRSHEAFEGLQGLILRLQALKTEDMRTRVHQCLQVSDRDHEGSEVKWVMAGYCEHCDTTLEELYTERTGPQTHSDRVYSDSCSH